MIITTPAMPSNPQPSATCIQDYDILGTGRNSSPVHSRLLDAGSLAQPTDTGCDIGIDGNKKVYECIIGINIFPFVIAF
jgi:hypothetical protein